MTKLKIDSLPTGEHPLYDDYTALFINDIPLLDVRAPIEFEQGAFPNSTNIPLMEDDEREAVGIRYKEQGQESAILLGAELIGVDKQAQRKQQWAEFIQNHPTAVLYCFRGGLRSQISQQWIFDQTQQEYPRVEGGYKALRRFLIESTERIAKQIPIVILGGRTGSGKTRVLKQLKNSIDLEGLANHRGSAFGPTATPQPTPINFENALAVALLKQEAAGAKFLVIEDEARNVGSLGVPQALYDAMQTAPIVKLNVPQQDRNKISIEEYIVDTQTHFDKTFGKEQGKTALAEHLLSSLSRIQKRLGGERYKTAQVMMESAITQWHKEHSFDGFTPLVNTLLVDYYDPMYDYQIAKKIDRIQYEGSVTEVLAYLRSYEV